MASLPEILNLDSTPIQKSEAEEAIAPGFSNPFATLSRLQIVDASSPSKPDNYRVSPITPPSTSGSVPVDVSLDVKEDVQAIFDDWSGRGPHVDFLPNEEVPLIRGRFLGHGSMGGVYETTVRGQAFAWKTRFCRRRIGQPERKEIEILKKVSHKHIVRLAGSYTHRQFLGLLLYPVAACDLATFLEDVEACFSNVELDSTQKDRFSSLGIMADLDQQKRQVIPSFLSAKIGCIICAVEYLHSQRIRHKDLKPSNILLSKGGLWLTDFGSATDFSTLTLSSTENGERGTEKYFAPEVAAFQPSGRSADIFSLGCVLLELYVMVSAKSLSQLRNIRTIQPGSFHANLDSVQDLLQHYAPDVSPFGSLMTNELGKMLAREATARPTIDQIRSNFVLIDAFRIRTGYDSLFGDCCRSQSISEEEHERKMSELKVKHRQEIQNMQYEEMKLRTSLEVMKEQVQVYQSRLDGTKMSADKEVSDITHKLLKAYEQTQTISQELSRQGRIELELRGELRISKEEARRAWEELGRREQSHRNFFWELSKYRDQIARLSENNLLEHYQDIPCQSCDQVLQSREDYLLHKMEKHYSDNSFVCHCCQRIDGRNKKFSTASGFRQHIADRPSHENLFWGYDQSFQRSAHQNTPIQREPRKTMSGRDQISSWASEAFQHRPLQEQTQRSSGFLGAIKDSYTKASNWTLLNRNDKARMRDALRRST